MKYNRLIALGLTGAMLLTLSGCTTSTEVQGETTATETTISADLENAALSMLSAEEAHSSEAGKEETVYVITDADGKVKQTIVESWVKNPEGTDTLKDVSDLTEIENTKGNQTYTQEADGIITWQADGSDIYYQGYSDNELPVEVTITYILDGKTVTAEELAGASGHLTIQFDYTNNTGKISEVDGEECTIYQPYVVVSGLLMNNEKAANVTVSNGKVINDGDRSIVVGLAIPGLRESLGLDDLTIDGKAVDIEVPDDVVIEADVVDFSLMTTMTIVSDDALSELGLNDVEDIDDLRERIQELSDGSQELVDGTSEFSDYMGELNEAAGDLANGADELDGYMNTLNDGLNTLQSAVSDLPDGADQLLQGTRALRTALKSGSNSSYGVYEALGAMVSGAQKLESAAESIMNGADQLASGADQIAAGAVSGSGDSYGIYEAAYAVEQGLGEAASQLSAGLASAEENLSTADSLSQTAMGILQSAQGWENLSEEQQAALAGALQAVDGSDQYIQGVNAALSSTELDLTSATSALEGIQSGAQSIAAAAEQISAGARSHDYSSQSAYGIYEAAYAVESGAESLESAARSLMGAVNTMTDDENLGAIIGGLEELCDSGDQLVSAVNQLSQGSSSLAEGTGDLSDGSSEMKDAVQKLYDSSITLKEGMAELDEEGIQQIADLVNGDLSKLFYRLQAVQDYAKENTTYSGVADGVECATRFIFKSDEIG